MHASTKWRAALLALSLLWGLTGCGTAAADPLEDATGNQEQKGLQVVFFSDGQALVSNQGEAMLVQGGESDSLSAAQLEEYGVHVLKHTLSLQAQALAGSEPAGEDAYQVGRAKVAVITGAEGEPCAVKLTYGNHTCLLAGGAVHGAQALAQSGWYPDCDVLALLEDETPPAVAQAYLDVVFPDNAILCGIKNASPDSAYAQMWRADTARTVRLTSDGSTYTLSAQGEASTTYTAGSRTAKMQCEALETEAVDAEKPHSAQEIPAPPTQAPSAQEAQTALDTPVYVTASGKKYHQEGCSALRSSKSALSVQEAQEKGYTPCAKCW